MEFYIYLIKKLNYYLIMYYIIFLFFSKRTLILQKELCLKFKMDTTAYNIEDREAASFSIITPISNTTEEEPDLDSFIRQARVNALESMNTNLRKKLNIEKNEGLDEKEAYVKKIKELTTELELSDYKNEAITKELETTTNELEATTNELEATKKTLLLTKKEFYATSRDLEGTKKEFYATSRTLEATKKEFYATSRDLDKTSRDLEATKKELYATSRALEAETLLHKESRKAINEKEYEVYQNEQDIKQLKLKIAKLKETFMESVSELRELRGALPHSMVGMYPPQFPNREYPRMDLDLDFEVHHPYKRKAIEPEFQEHYSKRKSISEDLQEIIQSKNLPRPERYKRICHYGKSCRYPICDYAHSIADLIVCRQGMDCVAKSYCGYMIHSEKERTQLESLVKSRGINVVLCKDYDKYKKCQNGEHCNKIHSIH